MSLSIELSGLIEISHYRGSILLEQRVVNNAVQKAAATAVATGLASGANNKITHMQVELESTSGQGSGQNAQKPMFVPTNINTPSAGETGWSVGTNVYRGKGSVTITGTHTSNGSYPNIDTLKIGYSSGGTNFVAYAEHTLSPTAITVETGDKVEITWYIGSPDPNSIPFFNDSIPDCLAAGASVGRPSHLGYATYSGGSISNIRRVAISSYTVDDTPTNTQDALYTSTQFTGGAAETPEADDQVGIFGTSNELWAYDASPVFDISGGTNYVLHGHFQVSWS